MANRLVSVDSITQMLPGMVRESLEVDFAPPRGKLGTGPLAPVPALNIVDFGADPTGVADSTAAIRAAAAAGNHLYFPPGTFKVSTVADNTPLISFTGVSGVIIDAREATLSNPTSYTADTITPMFQFDNCQNVRVELGEYVGFTLPTPATHLGYRGATLVQAVNGTDGLYVNAKITNARYGVTTGAYATPSAGGCKNFDLRLRTSMVGYTIAAYLATGIRVDIEADGVHRAAYFAGCDDVRGVVRVKNIYVAPVAVLITDALTSGTDAAAQIDPVGAATTSRGSSNVDLTVIFKPSSAFQPNTFAAGISLSRVDPVVFRSIRVHVVVEGATDALSTQVHGFSINSTAKAIWSRYAFNWEPHVVLENIKISGVVDKALTTITNGTEGPLSIRAFESSITHAATIRELFIDGYVVRQGSAGYSAAQILARGISTPIRFRGYNAPGPWLVLDTSTTIPTILEGCTIPTLSTGATAYRAVLGAGTVVSAFDGNSNNIEVSGGRVGGGGPVVKQKELVSPAMSGATVTWSGPIPPNSLVLGVQVRVRTAITGATGFDVGVSGDLARYGTTALNAVGTQTGPSGAALVSPMYYSATTDILVTAKVSNFTAGVVRIVLSYIEFPALTS